MKPLDSIHVPVLLDDCVRLVTGANGEKRAQLAASHAKSTTVTTAKADDMLTVVDCTLGLAGHTEAFLHASPNVRVIGIDRDQHALDLATKRISESFGSELSEDELALRFIPVHSTFNQIRRVLDSLMIDTVDCVFMDLGLSSLQIDDTERGFSYSSDSPLDMRMDDSETSGQVTASQILNTYTVRQLTDMFKEYGEEKFSHLIAVKVVEQREIEPFEMSSQLVRLVDSVVPKAGRPAGNPAKRVFQALRIEVNGELRQLESVLPQTALCLNVGGRIVIESYHSLEDKTVKRFFTQGLVADVPAGLPVIPPEQQPFFTDLTHGAIKADEEEVRNNPRSQSVRLRAVELTRPIPERMTNVWARSLRGAGITDPGRLIRAAASVKHNVKSSVKSTSTSTSTNNVKSTSSQHEGRK